MKLSIKDFIKEVGESMTAHGFREDEQKPSDFVAWIHSEASEVWEAFRIGLPATEILHGAGGKPEGIPTEIADIVILCFDMADYYGIDLEAAILEKQAYNEKRPYKHGKLF